MRVEISMTFSEAGNVLGQLSLDSANGAVLELEGRLWPVDLDLVNVIVQEIKSRRNRYPVAKVEKAKAK